MVTFTRRRTIPPPRVVVGGEVVENSRSARYLGVELDAKLNFGEHGRKASMKAREVATWIGRLMPNIGGASHRRRALLASVAQSVLLYGAPIWSDSLAVARNRHTMTSVLRFCAMRIICAYRTVSTGAALVLAGIPPIHLLADERKRSYERRREDRRSDDDDDDDGQSPNFSERRRLERERTLTKWQAEWETYPKGAWTREVVPDVGAWCRRKHGEVNYFVTQALTNHGCFGAYLHLMGKTTSRRCAHCTAETDDARHTIFECPTWQREREVMFRIVGQFGSGRELGSAMLRGPLEWGAIASFLREVMERKGEEERRRKTGRAGTGTDTEGTDTGVHGNTPGRPG